MFLSNPSNNVTATTNSQYESTSTMNAVDARPKNNNNNKKQSSNNKKRYNNNNKNNNGKNKKNQGRNNKNNKKKNNKNYRGGKQQQRGGGRKNNKNNNNRRKNKTPSALYQQHPHSLYFPPLSRHLQENIVAIDCEMVGAGPDGTESLLARVVLVDFRGRVLLDQYVTPTRPVTDYRTHVSGIIERHLVDFGSPLDHVRAMVRGMIQTKILVGHALKNDLQALQLDHPWQMTRDTAKYEPYMKPIGTAFIPKRQQPQQVSLSASAAEEQQQEQQDEQQEPEEEQDIMNASTSSLPLNHNDNDEDDDDDDEEEDDEEEAEEDECEEEEECDDDQQEEEEEEEDDDTASMTSCSSESEDSFSLLPARRLSSPPCSPSRQQLLQLTQEVEKEEQQQQEQQQEKPKPQLPSFTTRTVMGPRKLRDLAWDFLGCGIQVPGIAHCPLEDARAAMDLYKLVHPKWEKKMKYKISKTRQLLRRHSA